MTANSSGLENNHTGKLNAGAAMKLPTLSSILNHITVSTRNSISHSSKLSPGTSNCKKNIPTCNSNAVSSRTVVLPASSSVRPSCKLVSIQRSDAVVPKISAIPPTATCIMDISPSHSDILVSMDESMDTVRSPEVEYIDDHESTAVDSTEKDKKRPSTNFMRAILIDYLVEVAEENRLVPGTLHLTINYIDQYISGNLMDRK